MPNNLTGQNISDTFQRVVQIENGVLSDGTGSAIPITISGNDVTITGTLHAVDISSSRVTSSVIYTSGSSTFGDQASDTHTFLGAITASGQISSSGTGANYFGGAIQLPTTTKIQWTDANQYIYGTTTQIQIDGNDRVKLIADNDVVIDSPTFETNGAITASGAISASGNVYGDRLYIQDMPLVKVGDTISLGSNGLQTTNRLIASNITASGDISASATSYIQTPELRGHGTATQLHVQGQITASGDISSSGTIVANKIETATLFSRAGDANTGLQFGSDTVDIEANDVIIGKFNTNQVQLNSHVTASGNISASGEIIGSKGIFTGALPLVANTTGHQAFVINSDGNANNNPFMEFQQDGTRRAFIQFNDTDNTLKLTSEFGNLELRAASTAGSDTDTTYLTVKAGGTISASANLTVGGHITASGNISSSGHLYGQNFLADTSLQVANKRILYTNNDLEFRDTGLNIEGGHITASANISASGFIYSNKYLLSNSGTDYNFSVYHPSTNAIRVGSSADNSVGLSLQGHVTGSGNISTTKTVTGATGSFGSVEGTSFIGTPIVIEHLNIYASSVEGPHAEFRLGTGVGSEAGTWTSTIVNADGDFDFTEMGAPPTTAMLNGYILPYKMKNIQAKIAARSQGSGIPTFWMFTGSRTNSEDAFDLGWAASSSIAVPGASGHYNMDITGSKAFTPNDGHDVLFMYVSNAAANTKHFRITAVISGEIAGKNE